MYSPSLGSIINDLLFHYNASIRSPQPTNANRKSRSECVSETICLESIGWNTASPLSTRRRITASFSRVPHQNAVGMAGNGGSSSPSWSSHRFWGIPSLAIIHKLSLRERNAWIPFARAYAKPDSKPPRKWYPLANMRFEPVFCLAKKGCPSSDRLGARSL